MVGSAATDLGLDIRELSFRYGQRSLFSGVEASIGPGEIVHLRGPNGAGKSTLLSVVAGLLEMQEGAVLFAGSEELKPHIEYLAAEANGHFLKLSARANLRFWSDLRQLDITESMLTATLNTWGLKNPILRDVLAVEKFSTGMRRRLALARVSLSRAPVWLLDEPIYGLDLEGIRLFREALERHREGGGLGIVISHDYPAIEGIATRILELSLDSKGARSQVVSL